jgi:hypothetical protein
MPRPSNRLQSDLWKSSIETTLGIAITKRNMADAVVLGLQAACTEELAQVPPACATLLRNEGAGDAWAEAVDLLHGVLNTVTMLRLQEQSTHEPLPARILIEELRKAFGIVPASREEVETAANV